MHSTRSLQAKLYLPHDTVPAILHTVEVRICIMHSLSPAHGSAYMYCASTLTALGKEKWTLFKERLRRSIATPRVKCQRQTVNAEHGSRRHIESKFENLLLYNYYGIDF